ncbi:MAG: protein adenylyltransferase SelO family protein, partial [Candidatus Thermoplasmatota archaeon]|nr:protein adenylyltransferase SelO family protein [Candidatus Thermoplasmatota archaeon]
WMRHGFVHGVMNTDNMSIHGLTIDYGPFGWLEAHDPSWTPNTTDLPGRRYRYAAQPDVVGWNLARLLEAVAMVMDDPEPLHGVLDAYREAYRNARQQAWVERLGLDAWTEADEALVRDLQHVMHASEVDHVPMLRHMAEGLTTAEALQEAGRIYAVEPDLASINAWLGRWLERVGGAADHATMLATVPAFTPRNWVLQLAIDEAERGDWTKAEALAVRLMRPFDRLPEDEGAWWSGPRPEWAMTRPGCSMLSCSS